MQEGWGAAHTCKYEGERGRAVVTEEDACGTIKQDTHRLHTVGEKNLPHTLLSFGEGTHM